MLLVIGATATALVLSLSDNAFGQFGAGNVYSGRSDNPVGPTVSPYLNLLQQNPGAPTNYQSLVKPLINNYDALRQQGGAINRLQNQVNSGAVGRSGGGSGHTTFFMYYSHFYPSPSR
jgi:hypothetical protein